MQTQEMVLSPNQVQSVQLRWQEGQGEKTRDTFCVPYFLFLRQIGKWEG